MDFIYVGKISPFLIGHVIRRMRCGCRRIVNGILWEMSELITQERIAVGFQTWRRGCSRDPPCMTTDQGQKVKSQGHKVT